MIDVLILVLRGKIVNEAAEAEGIIYAHIGRSPIIYFVFQAIQMETEPQTMKDTRSGIPVTTQRRFDVYPDVSSTCSPVS